MSYAAQPPVTAPPPHTGARPPAVTTASALLWLMGAAGLGYAIATVAVAASAVSRFRDAASGAEADNFVSVIWLDAALAAVLSILAFALFVVLGLALRRGSRVARITALVVCGLGVLGGLGSLTTVLVQRSGDPVPGSIGDALGSAYPEGWIGLNVVVCALQVLGYLAVGAMLLTAPRTFFGYAPRPAPTGHPFPGHQPAFPGQQPTFPGQHPGFPGQQSGFPGQHPGFPGQQSGFPGQQSGFPGQPSAFPGQPSAFPDQSSQPAGQPTAFPGQPAAFPGQPPSFPGQPSAATGQPSSFGSPVAPAAPGPYGTPHGAPTHSPYGTPYPGVPGGSPAAAPSPYGPAGQSSPYAPPGSPAVSGSGSAAGGVAPAVSGSGSAAGGVAPAGNGSGLAAGGVAPAVSGSGSAVSGSGSAVSGSGSAAGGSAADGGGAGAGGAVGLPTEGAVDGPPAGSPNVPEGSSGWDERSSGGVTHGSGHETGSQSATQSGGGHSGLVPRSGDPVVNRPAPGSDDEYWRRPSE
ncbi:hypothetical protein BJY16_001684 [Actinoplanes octamycinicus]|uniref:Uncharacterized protein n=1 Tax=Actinoplanes octamycinicus TaxID=135948 RepID=A0A7W7M607_9ACTN|nr:hypothetical protein [Actinoplanes octamycinicus]MBB4738225.1 hypothetical protein [Actinoplanes octamycinicus]GIE59215.1 hypothetical protein Aoc01nite_46170 [Actinoplanes octamycinicus]